jgi:hypothetical protein
MTFNAKVAGYPGVTDGTVFIEAAYLQTTPQRLPPRSVATAPGRSAVAASLNPRSGRSTHTSDTRCQKDASL